MKIFEKGWLRLLINVALSAILFLGLVMGFADNNQGGCLFLGAFTLGGQVLFFLAFDTLGSFQNSFVGFIRYLLVIIGAVGILLIGVGTTVIFNIVAEVGNPWLYAFYTMWFLNGVLSFIFFYIINDEVLPEILYALVPLGSVIASYLLSVIFLYIGGAVHSFFNSYFGMVICLLLIIIMIIVIKVAGGIEFDGNFINSLKELAEQEAKASAKKTVNASSGVSDDNEEEVDNRKQPSAGLWNDVFEKAVQRAAENARSCSYIGQFGKVDNLSVNCVVIKSFKSINISGNITYLITTSNPNVHRSDFEDDAENLMEEVKDRINDNVENAIDSVQREYKGFDGEWNINTNLNSRIVK